MKAQFFKSGPREAAENARLAYQYSIAAARKTIRLAEAYFLPDALPHPDHVAVPPVRQCRVHLFHEGFETADLRPEVMDELHRGADGLIVLGRAVPRAARAPTRAKRACGKTRAMRLAPGPGARAGGKTRRGAAP